MRRQEGGITTGVALHNLESSPGLLRCDLMREGVLLDREYSQRLHLARLSMPPVSDRRRDTGGRHGLATPKIALIHSQMAHRWTECTRMM